MVPYRVETTLTQDNTLVLDTHVCVMWVHGDSRLPKEYRDCVQHHPGCAASIGNRLSHPIAGSH